MYFYFFGTPSTPFTVISAMYVNNFRSAVAAFREFEQLRRFIDEFRAIITFIEFFMQNDIFQKRYIRLDATDAEFIQIARHLLRRLLERNRPSGDFDEQ